MNENRGEQVTHVQTPKAGQPNNERDSEWSERGGQASGWAAAEAGENLAALKWARCLLGDEFRVLLCARDRC